MKVAIITSGFLPVIDGVTVSGMRRIERLSRWGHEVLLICPDYSALNPIYPHWKAYTGNILPGVKVVNVSSTPFMDLDFERNVSFFAYPEVIKALEAFEPEIIHVDEPERLFLGFWRSPGLAYARKHQIPCISFFRTNFLDYVEDYLALPAVGIHTIKFLFKFLIVSVYNAYDKTLVSSQVTHKKLIKLGIKNTQYANLLGFDREQFQCCTASPSYWESQHGLKDLNTKVKLLFLGRLTPDKGWNFTMNAFQTLRDNINVDDIVLLIAGDGPTRDQIWDCMQSLKIETHFLGRVSPEEVPEVLVNSDIHVTTSEKETRGLTVLEAFAAGIPVIAPNRGGVIENIKDGKNGYLFEPGNIQEFGEKLSTLITQPDLRQQMGQWGQESVADYTWDQTVQNLVQCWEALIAAG